MLNRRYAIRTSYAVTLLLATTAAGAGLAVDEQAAVFKTAGFERSADGRYIRCQEDTPTASYTPGAIEEVDVNGDGQAEVFVTESSMFCYGSPHTFFGLVAKGASGWKLLLDDVGIPVVLETRHGGWADIEVGSPGFGKFPVWQWNGSAYERVTPAP
jgi:hypothetical protein